jgi:hypothetical protein
MKPLRDPVAKRWRGDPATYLPEFSRWEALGGGAVPKGVPGALLTLPSLGSLTATFLARSRERASGVAGAMSPRAGVVVCSMTPKPLITNYYLL